MNVKHNAQFRVRCSAGLSGFPSDDIVEARLLDAHLTVLSVMHGFVSGLCAGDGAKVTVSLVDPSDILEDGQPCDCPTCLGHCKECGSELDNGRWCDWC